MLALEANHSEEQENVENLSITKSYMTTWHVKSASSYLLYFVMDNCYAGATYMLFFMCVY